MRARKSFAFSVVFTLLMLMSAGVAVPSGKPDCAGAVSVAVEGYKPNCSCSSESNWCDGEEPNCTCSTTCNATSGGCGTLWLYDCTGKCNGSGPCPM